MSLCPLPSETQLQVPFLQHALNFVQKPDVLVICDSLAPPYAVNKTKIAGKNERVGIIGGCPGVIGKGNDYLKIDLERFEASIAEIR